MNNDLIKAPPFCCLSIWENAPTFSCPLFQNLLELCFNDDNLLQLRHRTNIFPQTPSLFFLCVCALFFMGPAALWSVKCQKNHLTITKLKIKYSRKQTPMEIFKGLTRENSHLCAHGWLTEVNGNYVTASKISVWRAQIFSQLWPFGMNSQTSFDEDSR